MCVKRVSGGGGQGCRPAEQIRGVHFFGQSNRKSGFEFPPAEPAETIDARIQRLDRETTSLLDPLPPHARVRREARRLWKEAWHLRTTADAQAHKKLDELERLMETRRRKASC